MIGLSRPAAYARLARLRQVLDSDLDQPRTRLSLHLAMLVLKQDQESAASDGALSTGFRPWSARWYRRQRQ